MRLRIRRLKAEELRGTTPVLQGCAPLFGEWRESGEQSFAMFPAVLECCAENFSDSWTPVEIVE